MEQMEQYKTLRKLYYGDPETYQQVYERRFSESTTVHLDFLIGEHPAFFVQDNAVIQKVFSILRLDKEIALLKCQLPQIALQQYTRKCLIDEVVLTNQIEGIHSSRKEIGDVLDELEEQSTHRRKKLRFDGIVKKYVMLKEGESLALETCQDVRDLYDALVLDEVMEEAPQNRPDGILFRKGQTEIKSATDKILHKGIYPEEKIFAALEKALAFLGDGRIESLYRICLFHYLLEYIHPFYDGNGRLGRFVVSEYLARTMDPLLGYRLSKTVKENIQKYYKAFDTCNHPRNRGDLTPFLLMMLGMIEQSEEDLKESLKERVTLLNRYGDYIPQLPNAEKRDMQDLYFLLIQAALFGEAGISTRALQHCLPASYGKVRALLNSVPDELLDSKRVGREKYYSLKIENLPV